MILDATFADHPCLTHPKWNRKSTSFLLNSGNLLDFEARIELPLECSLREVLQFMCIPGASTLTQMKTSRAWKFYNRLKLLKQL